MPLKKDHAQKSAQHRGRSKNQVLDLHFCPVWHVHADTGSSHSSGRTIAPVGQKVQA